MSWFTRTRVPGVDGHAVEPHVAEALATVSPQVEALTALLPQRLAEQTVMPLLQRLTAWAWMLPASEAHHHSRPFGLLVHSLEVAQHALVLFTQSSLWWSKVPDPAQRHAMQARWRLGTALAGLLHDVGKAFDVTVTLSASRTPWEPLQTGLLPWLLAQQTAGTVPTPTITWQPGRGMRHETAGALAATLLLTRMDLTTLTLPVARELWVFLGGVPDPSNLFRQLLTAPATQAEGVTADQQSVRDDLQTVPPPQPALAAQVLTALAQACHDGTLRVNQFPGQVFVLPEQTLVVVPEVFKVLRPRLTQVGVTLPGTGILYNDLAAAGYLRGPAGQNVTQATILRPGKRPVTLAVLRISNPMIWGVQTPPLYGGDVVLEAQDDPVPLPTDITLVTAPAPGMQEGSHG